MSGRALARAELPRLVGLAAVLAGLALLAQGLLADLRSHAAAHATLEARLGPQAAALVAAADAREAANPWHRVLVGGQALFSGGLVLLYLAERRRGCPRCAAERAQPAGLAHNVELPVLSPGGPWG